MTNFGNNIISNNTLRNRGMPASKKITILLLIIGVVGIGVYAGLKYLTPHAQEKSLAKQFLTGMYGGKTKPQEVRKLATPALQVAKSDDELTVANSASQRITAINYTKIDAPDEDTAIVSGTMKSDQPVANPGSKDVISNSFALRLAKVGGEWKVDAYLVQ